MWGYVIVRLGSPVCSHLGGKPQLSSNTGARVPEGLPVKLLAGNSIFHMPVYCVRQPFILSTWIPAPRGACSTTPWLCVCASVLGIGSSLFSGDIRLPQRGLLSNSSDVLVLQIENITAGVRVRSWI